MQVIATAGHVDHGKSALVRALTGMEPDRWAEERRRGLTIDLGFAWMTLPGGDRVAFVDVPGHERFVPNMLAGVGPAPAVLLVVAADGGWMPQSAEHLAAIDAVGIRHGLLAVTRCDLADPGPATRQALDFVSRTSLGSVEAVAVSAVTGAGLPELRDALARLVAALPAPDPAAPVRLWVDRSFSIRGSGTVVTGTLPAGTITAGQELLLTPSLRPARIRGLESLNEPATSVTGVARVAVNLRGIPAGFPARGMALVEAGRWTLTKLVDVRLSAPAEMTQPCRDEAACRDDPAHRLRAHAGPDSLLRDLGDRPADAARRAAAARRRPRPAPRSGQRRRDDPGRQRARRRAAGAHPTRCGRRGRERAGRLAGAALSGRPAAPPRLPARRHAGRHGRARRPAARGGRLACRPGPLGQPAAPAGRGGRGPRQARPAGHRHAARGRPRRPRPARPGADRGAGPGYPGPGPARGWLPADRAVAAAAAGRGGAGRPGGPRGGTVHGPGSGSAAGAWARPASDRRRCAGRPAVAGDRADRAGPGRAGRGSPVARQAASAVHHRRGQAGARHHPAGRDPAARVPGPGRNHPAPAGRPPPSAVRVQPRAVRVSSRKPTAAGRPGTRHSCIRRSRCLPATHSRAAG